MPAYLVANIEVTDPAGFERYRTAVPEVIARFDDSADYAPLLKLRLETTRSEVALVEGYAG